MADSRPRVVSRGRVIVDGDGVEVSPATSTIQTANGVLLGAVTETAPATDTASSGLNGRIQRIAQRITSLIAQIPAALGMTTAAGSMSVVQASDSNWLNNINGGLTAGRAMLMLGYNGNTKLVQLGAGGQTLTRSYGLEYETVAASQTAQVIGATGATGDYLGHIMVQPTTTAPGVVTILDNAIEVHAYPGGTVGADLLPFRIDIDANSVSGAWKITTGANVKCTAYGDFT